jgi:uncharacterized protein (TIGR00106 family)
MLVAFSVTPLGVGEDVGEIVAEAVRAVRESGLPNQTDAMFTTVEGDWDEAMAVVKKAVEAVAARAPRVSLVLKADLRPGRGEAGPQAERVEQNLALVVGSAAAVQSAVAFGWLERRVVPAIGEVGRLDVVMAVDEHARRSVVGGRPVGVDGGQACCLPDLRDREAGFLEVSDQPFRRPAHVAVVRWVGGNRRDRQPPAQCLRKLGGVRRDILPNVHEP